MNTRRCTAFIYFPQGSFKDDGSIEVDGVQIPVLIEETGVHVPIIAGGTSYILSADFIGDAALGFLKKHGHENCGRVGPGVRHHRGFSEEPDPSRVLYVTIDGCRVGVPEEAAA